MIKRMMAIVLLLTLVGASGAQSVWVAWVYTPSDGSILRVSAKGEIVDAYRLPLSQAFNSYGPAAVASPSGRFVAYTASDSTASSGNRQLFVYDTRGGILRFTYDLSSVSEVDFERLARSSAFDESAQTFAFGVLRNGGWDLVLASLATESVIGGQPLSSESSGLGGADTLPMVLSLQGDRVHFLLLPVGMAEQITTPVYSWRPAESPVEAGNLSALSDTSANGEFLTPLYDASQSTTGDVNDASSAYNAIDAVSSDDTHRRLANTTDVELSQVWNVAGGRQILARAFSPNRGETVLLVLTREGVPVGELAGNLDDIHATPVGFAGLFPTGSGVGLASVDTSSADIYAQTLWTSADPVARLLLIE